MKKTTLFILALVAITITTRVTAQDTLFDLKSYKTTNYERSSLDLNFNLNEVGVNQSNEQLDPMEKENTSVFNSGLNMQSAYSKIIYSQKKIVDYGSSLNLSEYYQRSRIEQPDSSANIAVKTSTYNGTHGLSGYYNLNSYYSPTNKNFFIIGGTLSIVGRSRYQQSEEEIENKNNLSSVDANLLLKLGHGHGRIENVEDAVEAMYILGELGENGILSRKFSGADIKALADKITFVRKERYFDERLYRKKSMSELVSLLEESGLISQGNIDVFNSIADYHYYAGIQERPSGQKLEYYLTPGFIYGNSTNFSSTAFNRKYGANEYKGNIGLAVAYGNYKPISVKWQRSIYAEVKVGNSRTFRKTESLENESTYSSSFKSYQLDGLAQAGISYGYYPSTRSNLTAGLNGQYNYRNDISDDKSSNNFNNSFSADLNIRGYYYLSSKLRLSGNFGLVSDFQKAETIYDNVSMNEVNDRLIQNNFSLALTYYIF